MTEEALWTCRQVTITIQVEMETLELIQETLKVGESCLFIFLKGHKPRCFRCGQKGHIRAECTLPKEKDMEGPEFEAAKEVLREAREEKEQKEQTQVKDKSEITALPMEGR